MFLCVAAMIFYFTAASALFLLPVERYKKKNILSHINSFFAWIFIWILNIRAVFTGENNYSDKKSWYIMGNHVSFVDVFLIVARFRTLLITSTDMKKRAFLGQVAVISGCLFVDRHKITTLRNEIPEIGNAFRRKLNVCFFPESTCSNGQKLLPFKSSLMSAVTGTGAEILPVCIMYKKINNSVFKPDDFARIGYFGGMKFMPQFMKVMMLKSLDVELEMLKPLPPENLERKELGAIVFERVNSRYQSYLEEIGAVSKEI
jgi:1-acyl-sn-glycerol-3-phosphate acyltransferase